MNLTPNAEQDQQQKQEQMPPHNQMKEEQRHSKMLGTILIILGCCFAFLGIVATLGFGNLANVDDDVSNTTEPIASATALSDDSKNEESEPPAQKLQTSLMANNNYLIPIEGDYSPLVYDPNTKIVYYQVHTSRRGYMSVFYIENGKICRYNEETNMIEEIEN